MKHDTKITLYVFLSLIKNGISGTYWQPMSPWRWLVAIAVPLLVVHRALKKKNLDLSGGIAGQSKCSVVYLPIHYFFTDK